MDFLFILICTVIVAGLFVLIGDAIADAKGPAVVQALEPPKPHKPRSRRSGRRNLTVHGPHGRGNGR